MTPFAYRITGVSSRIGEVLSIDAFADRLQIPDAHSPDGYLKGALLRRLFGYCSKSWDRAVFSCPEELLALARRALASAKLRARDVEALVVLTCTPWHPHLDQDSFFLARTLALREEIPVLQIGAGCAGPMRAFALVQAMQPRNALVVAYSLSSLWMSEADGKIRSLYTAQSQHAKADRLWFSVATFSDGAGALVLSRTETHVGAVSYARGTDADPLIWFRGGGAAHPPDLDAAENAQSVFEISTEAAARYYRQAMGENHEELSRYRSDYLCSVRRLYLHQASPRAVLEHYESVAAPAAVRHAHAEILGNMASPSTMVLLHDDVRSGAVEFGDEVAFSLVGAGPERGCALVSVCIADPSGEES